MMSPVAAKSVDLGVATAPRLQKWKHGNWAGGGGALSHEVSACGENQAALELPAKPYLISCLDRPGNMQREGPPFLIRANPTW